MAGFNLRALALLASMNYTPGGSNQSIFTYGTTDALATVLTDGYFNGARDKAKLKANDLVIGIASGTAFCLKFAAVPASGNVTTAIADLAGGGGVTGDQAAIEHLTDNSGGAATDTLAAISDADTKNAIASLAAKVNGILAALETAGLLEEPA